MGVGLSSERLNLKDLKLGKTEKNVKLLTEF
jgi:hypothetical protein